MKRLIAEVGEDFHLRIKKKALRKNMTITEIICQLLEKWLKDES